jgi:uncharacterized membrane protein YfcA
MDYLIVCISAFFVSGLTLFSGFGLGTLLLPVFALFFPIQVAVAMTAIVHFLNNIFKLGLLGKYAKLKIVLEFGIPAFLAAFLGAWALVWLSGKGAVLEYQLFNRSFEILPIKLIVAGLIAFFALAELNVFKKLRFENINIFAGGFLSGFLGGLSGLQGALRSAFLLKFNLSKEQFIGTGVVIACLVDVCRLSVYGKHFAQLNLEANRGLIAAAVAAAFIGAFLGRQFLKKVTISFVHKLVSWMLIGIAVGLGVGII